MVDQVTSERPCPIPPSTGLTNRLSRYIRIHTNVLAQLMREGFVCTDGLEFVAEPESGTVQLRGNLACLGGIVIAVDKLLAILDAGEDPQVQTDVYKYNVSVAGAFNVFRYDNAEHYSEHPDVHHRHDFNWRTGDELSSSPRWVGAEDWPRLDEVIREARDWYYDNRPDLPEPDLVPDISNRRY